MIGDIAIAQILEKDRKSKALFLLPLVSLAIEKYNQLRKKFKGFQIRAFFGNNGANKFNRGAIGVCTYEKTQSILNDMVMHKTYKRIKVVIIDEVHMIGDKSRGPLLENIITRLLCLNIWVICLTATLSIADTQVMARWMHGWFYIKSQNLDRTRISVIRKSGQQILIKDGNEIIEYKSGRSLDVLIYESIYINPTPTIIFVNSKADTVRVSKSLCTSLKTIGNLIFPSTLERQTFIVKMVNSSSSVSDYKECLEWGIAPHNAGMSLNERKLVEEAIQTGVIMVIVATTTLAAGVDISTINQVVIHNIFRWMGKDVPDVRLPKNQYIQMIGRAGRSVGSSPKAIIIENDKMEYEDIKELINAQLESISLSFFSSIETDKYILQMIACGQLPNKGTIYGFFSRLFTLYLRSEYVKPLANVTIERLSQKKLIEINGILIKTTRAGSAISESLMNICEIDELDENINKLNQNICLKDDLNLLFLCVPPSMIDIPPYELQSYDSDPWISLFQNHSHVIQLILPEYTESYISRLTTLATINGRLGRRKDKIDEDKILERIFCAQILLDLINEVEYIKISKKYKIDIGALQMIQTQVTAFIAQLIKYCAILDHYSLHGALHILMQRVSFATKGDLMELMKLPNMRKELARRLYNINITSPSILKKIPINILTEIALKALTGILSIEEINQLVIDIKKDAKIYEESMALLENIELIKE
jgi:replicative superfamily II helicase